MKILIISTGNRLRINTEFVNCLNELGIDATCVLDSDYLYLGTSKPFYTIPTPMLLKLTKKLQPDFVIADSPYYAPYLLNLIKRPALVRIIGAEQVSDAGVNFDIANYPSLFERIYTLYLSKITRPSLKKSGLTLPNCEWLKEQMDKKLPFCKSRVLYDGISSNYADTTLNSNSIHLKHPAVVGLFQFVVYQKVVGLLKFQKIAKQMTDINFYFAGNGPYLELVRRHCAPNVHLLGKLSRDQASKLLVSGDIFVHPSGLDALPSVVKEASIMKRPIIASNVGGIPEMMDNNKTGYLCSIDDDNAWVNKIQYLLDNPQIGKEFGEKAYEFVKYKFDWRKISEDFVLNLNSFITSGKIPSQLTN